MSALPTSPDRSTHQPALDNQEFTRVLRAEIAAGRYGAAGRLPSGAQLVQRFKEKTRPA